ncbi:MAG: M57 family metalloprotease [Cyclobacteriaceae bacterium]
MKDGNYLVEGDIVISPAELATLTDEVNTTGPSGEQYRTCNIVSALRTITVAGSGLTGTQDQALDMAVDNFNGLNLSLNFQRVYSGKADITVTVPATPPEALQAFPARVASRTDQ